MKFVKQFAIFVTICFIGEVLHKVIPLPVPASIYGLVLMFCALKFKIMPLQEVEVFSDSYNCIFCKRYSPLAPIGTAPEAFGFAECSV